MTLLLLVIPLLGFILVNVPPEGNLRRRLIACPLILSLLQTLLMLVPGGEGWLNSIDVGPLALPFLRLDGISMLMFRPTTSSMRKPNRRTIVPDHQLIMTCSKRRRPIGIFANHGFSARIASGSDSAMCRASSGPRTA